MKFVHLLILLAFAFPVPAAGVVLTVDDLNYVKAHLQEEPWRSGFEALKHDWRAKVDYRMRGAREKIVRYPWTRANIDEWEHDMTAAWHQARMWAYTGDERHAKKSREILIAWADTLKKAEGWEICFEIGGEAYKWAGAADILRQTWKGWSAEDTAKMQKFFKEVYLPGTGWYSHAMGPTAKGAMPIPAVFAIAAFCEDRQLMKEAVDLFLYYPMCGLRSSISTGQNGESGRDQGHWYWMIQCQTVAAMIAWNQGIDLFSVYDNRLLAQMEFYARHNLPEDSPSLPLGCILWVHPHVVKDRGWTHGRLGYQMVKTSYARLGLETPAIDRWLDSVNNSGIEDVFSFILETKKPKNAKDAKKQPRVPRVVVPTGKTVSPKQLTYTPIGKDIPSHSGFEEKKGVYTLRGGGKDFWRHAKRGEEDNGAFVGLTIKGDGMMSCKVESLEAKHDKAKLVLMMRSDLTTKPQYKAWVGVTPKGALECFMDGWKSLFGGENYEKTHQQLSGEWDNWLKVERRGNQVTVWWSPDGTSWTCYCSAWYEGLPETLHFGLGLATLIDDVATAKITGLAATGGDGLLPTPKLAAPLAVSTDFAASGAILRWSESAFATSYGIARSRNGKAYEPVGKTTHATYIDLAGKPGDKYRIVPLRTARDSRAGASTR